MKSFLTALVVCALLPLQARAQSFAPAGWAEGVKLAEARDTNPDPNIVGVTLTAKLADVEVAPGKTVHAWTTTAACPVR